MKRITKNEKRALALRCFAKLVLFAERQGIELFEIEGHRTMQRQRQLVKAGKSWTMNSRHTVKHLTAKDFGIFKRREDANGTIRRTVDWNGESYKPLGEYWTSLHPLCVWGGNWKIIRDYGHFEVH